MRFEMRIAMVALALSIPMAAHAGDNDFRLNRTRNDRGILFREQGVQNCNDPYCPNQELFKAFATQLGFVFSPRLASPAETLGHAGFHVGTIWSGTFVSADQDYWDITDKGQRDGKPSNTLHTLQLDIRKGLPFSFEVGVNFMWLVDSELFAPGLEIRWALQEGYEYIPDFGIRGSVNHMVGSRDMLLTTVGIDAVLSKSFGLFGMVNVAPYLSWSFLLIAATSRVIDPTPSVEITEPIAGRQITRSDIENNFVFEEVTAGSDLHHKLTAGLRLIFYVLNVSVQGEFQMVPKGGGFFGPVATISTKLGLDF